MARQTQKIIELLGKSAFAQGQLLIRLAADHPRLVSREELVRSLYPDSEPAAARNRLRVALTRLRKTVALREEGDLIGLEPEAVLVDLQVINEELESTRHEPDAPTELARLGALAPQLGLELFPGGQEEWQIAAQTSWSQTAILALERLMELADSMADHGAYLSGATAMLKHLPHDALCWRRYLVAMHHLGRGNEAEVALKAARAQAKKEGLTLSKDLGDWPLPQDDESVLGPELSAPEVLALSRFFRRVLVAEPDLATTILGGPSFRPEVIRAPEATLPLLREALRLESPPSEARERIQVRVITALGLLGEHAETLAAANDLLSGNVAPARRRIALLNASFASASLGDIGAALDAVEEAMSLATEPFDHNQCRAQRAAFLIMQGDLESAEAELRSTVEYLRAHHQEGSEPDFISISGNLGLCLLLQGRPHEAILELQPVVEQSYLLRLPSSIGISAPVLGLALAEVGRSWGKLLTDGLRESYRMGPRRVVTAAACAGRALLLNGQDPEANLLREACAHRRAIEIPLNAIERFFFRPVRGDDQVVSRPLVEFIREAMRRCAIQSR